MTLDPILTAPLIIQLHVVGAICAIVLGPMALFRRSRDIWHRRLGYAWVMAMAFTAVSSFWISEAPIIGLFGPIHALSVLTIYGLWRGISAARAGNIAAHRGQMQGLYFWAMGVAGLFTFLPGRRMNSVFFDMAPLAGFIAMAVVIGGVLVVFGMTQKHRTI
jgi:uncharacterized membrane protein